MSDRTHAPAIFTGIAPEYSWMGAIWSFGQDARWRRTMVARLNAAPGSRVLDVAAGTGLVSRELAGRKLVRVARAGDVDPKVVVEAGLVLLPRLAPEILLERRGTPTVSSRWWPAPRRSHSRTTASTR